MSPKTADAWCEDYGRCHRHPTNKLIHWLCIPLILASVLGLLDSVPFPGTTPAPLAPLESFGGWAWVLILAALGFYLRLSWRLALGMLAVSCLALLFIRGLEWLLPWSRLEISLAIFVLAWIAQFVGHRIEGAKPAFLEDLKFLLIGPLWLLVFLYRRLGIPY